MLKIKMSINANSVYLNGLYYDANQKKCSINKECSSEQHAHDTIWALRENDCEFSLVVLRKA